MRQPYEIDPEAPQLWNKAKTAEYLGVSTKALDRWRKEGKGPKSHKVGVQVRYKPEEVYAWVESL